MRADSLRHRVDLQVEMGPLSPGDDSRERWKTYEQRWASVVPLSGRELFTDQQVHAQVTHKIGMRWKSGIQPAPTHRVKWGSRVFNIVSAINVGERNREIELVCIEVFPPHISTCP